MRYVIGLLIVLLAACGGGNGYITTKDEHPALDRNQRYGGKYVSSLPPGGNELWNYTYDEQDGTLSFGYHLIQNDNTLRNASISIIPFAYVINPGSFESTLHSLKTTPREYKQYDISTATKAGMQCIVKKEKSSTGYFTSNKVIYLCFEKNHPSDFPPVHIMYSEGVRIGMPLSNPDTIMAPIWNSIQVKPADHSSTAYQTWLKKNTERRARQRARGIE